MSHMSNQTSLLASIADNKEILLCGAVLGFGIGFAAKKFQLDEKIVNNSLNAVMNMLTNTDVAQTLLKTLTQAVPAQAVPAQAATPDITPEIALPLSTEPLKIG